MNMQDLLRWPLWVGCIAATSIFIATLAARELAVFEPWHTIFLPVVAASALFSFAAGGLVIVACTKLDRARLIRHRIDSAREPVSEEREYIVKAAAELTEVMQRPFLRRDGGNRKGIVD